MIVIRNYWTGEEITGPEADRRRDAITARSIENDAHRAALRSDATPRAMRESFQSKINANLVAIARIKGDLAPVRA